MEKFVSEVNQINFLFNNLNHFAANAASIDIKNFKPKLFDFYQYPLGLNWIGIRKHQLESIQDAFSALFILDLHEQNDWIYEEESKTSKDQYIIEKIPFDEWQTLLQSIWIEDYFQLYCRKPNVKPINIKIFQKKLLTWMPENTAKNDADSLKKILLTTIRVYSLFPDAHYDKFFGETKDYFFFAESGVYD